MTLPIAAFRPKAMVFSGFPSWLLKSGSSYAALDIDFVNNLAWNNLALVTISSLLTCTRASTGYYTNADGTLQSFLSNVLRYGTNGLLVEEARTNLALQTEALSAGNWPDISQPTTRTAASVTSADLSKTAYLVADNATANGNYGIKQTGLTIVASTTYALSFFAKKKDYQFLQVTLSTGGSSRLVFFDLTNGTTSGASGIVSASMQSLANGWWKCVMIATSGVGEITAQIVCIYGNSNGTSAHVGVVGTGTYLFGFGLEAGAFATSYIPTTSSSATRAADNIQPASLSWLNTSAGTFFGKGTSPTTSAYLLSGVSGVALPREGTASQAIADNGTNTLTATAGSSTWASVSKAAIAYDGSGRALCLNNGTVATDANLIGALSSLYVGSNAAGAGFWDGYIKELAWFNSKLGSAALQALTT